MKADTPKDALVERVQLWDPFIRLFHWTLAATVITGFLLGKFGPLIMTLHFYCGYAVGILLILRVIWGFVGSKPARFASFLYGPRQIIGYLKEMREKAPSYWRGHSPMGALSVFALLAVLSVQVVTGLISDPEDFVNVGPWADYVSRDVSKTAPYWHFLSSWALLGLVALHLGAIAFYRYYKHEDLVRPMITGEKLVRKDQG